MSTIIPPDNFSWRISHSVFVRAFAFRVTSRAGNWRVAVNALVLAMAKIVDTHNFPATAAAFIATASETIWFVFVVLVVPFAHEATSSSCGASVSRNLVNSPSNFI